MEQVNQPSPYFIKRTARVEHGTIDLNEFAVVDAQRGLRQRGDRCLLLAEGDPHLLQLDHSVSAGPGRMSERGVHGLRLSARR